MKPSPLATRLTGYAYIIIASILCIGTLVFLPIEPGYKLILEKDSPLPSPTINAAFLFTGCFLLLFFLQTYLSRYIDRKKAVLFLVVVIVLYFLCMPFFSGDVFLYSFKGKVQSESSQNPYLPVPSAPYIDSPYRILSVWIFTPVAYGPLTNLVFRVFYFESLSPLLNMYILKSVFLFFLGILLFIAYRETSPSNFIYFAFSPVILIETLLSAHMEIMPLLFFFLAILSFKKEKIPAAFLYAGLAAAFKLNYGLIVLPFLIERLSKKKLSLPPILFFLLPVVLSMFFYPDPRTYWDALIYESSKKGASVLVLFDSIPILKILFIILIGVAALYLIYRFFKKNIDIWGFAYLLFILVLFLDRNFQPWHLFPLYTIRLVQTKKTFDLTGFLSMTAMYGIYFLFYAWTPQQNFISSLILFIALLAALIGVSEQKFLPRFFQKAGRRSHH